MSGLQQGQCGLTGGALHSNKQHAKRPLMQLHQQDVQQPQAAQQQQAAHLSNRHTGAATAQAPASTAQGPASLLPQRTCPALTMCSVMGCLRTVLVRLKRLSPMASLMSSVANSQDSCVGRSTAGQADEVSRPQEARRGAGAGTG